MIKFKKFMSVMCAASVAASMAVMPAFAETTSAYNYEVKYTDDCTTKTHVKSRYEPYGATVNQTYGFVSYTQHSGAGTDHCLYFDYGVKGSYELTFDMFINDINYDVTSTVENGLGWSEGVDFDAVNEQHSNKVLQYNLGNNDTQGWHSTMNDDNGTALQIGTYARASRKYGAAPYGSEVAVESDSNPTHVNVKVVIEDGYATTYKKWNTSENWICTMSKRALSKWDPDNHSTIYWISGMGYIAVDNVVVKTPAWGLVAEDDCSAKNSFITASYGETAVNSNGFIWHTDKTGYGDHLFFLDYGLRGNFELSFDYFANDIDNALSENVLNGVGQWSSGTFIRTNSKIYGEKYNYSPDTGNALSWFKTLTTDNAEAGALKIGTYARASRKYNVPAKGEEVAPVIGEKEPTYVNVKIVQEDGKLNYYAKWNTEQNWISIRKDYQVKNYDPTKDMRFYIQGMPYDAIDNVVVKAPVYDSSLMPGMNPGSMVSVKPSITWMDNNGETIQSNGAPYWYMISAYAVINNAITDDFILSYDYSPVQISVKRNQWFYGTNKPDFRIGNASKADDYNGRIGIGDQNNDVWGVRGYFANKFPNEVTNNHYGSDLGVTIGKDYIKVGNVYKIVISYLDGELRYAIRNTNDENDPWHYYVGVNTAASKVGYLVYWQEDSYSDIAGSLKLWVPKKSVVMNPTIAQGEDGTITTSAKIADYTGSAEYVQPKLFTALYQTTADGNKKLCGVNISEDSKETSTVKTLTGSLTAPTAEGSYEVKAMVWDSINGLSPLTKATTDTITVAAATDAE